jgi:hypothetical protein
MSESKKQSESLKQAVERVKNHMRVTKVVCTRSVKGRFGDHYVGFSAAWDTIQDDAGGGADLLTAQDGKDAAAVVASGMTIKDARLAALILGMQADLAAHDHACAGSNITPDQHSGAVAAIKNNYMKLAADLLAPKDESK